MEAFKLMGIITHEEDEMDGYNRDYLGEYQGLSRLMNTHSVVSYPISSIQFVSQNDFSLCFGRVAVLPKNTEDVAKVVQYCGSNNLPVVPRGGNTGLVGGSVALSESSVVMSMSKMNKIE